MATIATIITFCLTFTSGFCLSFLVTFSMFSNGNSSRIDIFYNKIKTVILKVVYKLLYIYSVCQINSNKFYNFISPYIRSLQNIPQLFLEQSSHTSDNTISNEINTIIDVYDNTTLKQIFEKRLTKKFTEMNFNNLKCLDSFSNYTMIVTDSSRDKQNNINKKKIICDDYLEKYEFNFDLSEITFVALYLNYNNERYNINLKINDFNFYIVGNIINKTFLQYYLKNILQNDICIDTDSEELRLSYKLELMDHEVNMLSLTATQYIIIEKNGYSVGEKITNLENPLDKTVESNLKNIERDNLVSTVESAENVLHNEIDDILEDNSEKG